MWCVRVCLYLQKTEIIRETCRGYGFEIWQSREGREVKNYKEMWEELERRASFDLSMLADQNTVIDYADILRMAAGKLIQQTMIKIEREY